MHPVSCTNTPDDVTDLVNHGQLKIQKLEYFEIYYEIRIFFTSTPDDIFLEVIIF